MIWVRQLRYVEHLFECLVSPHHLVTIKKKKYECF